MLREAKTPTHPERSMSLSKDDGCITGLKLRIAEMHREPRIYARLVLSAQILARAEQLNVAPRILGQ